MALEVYSFNWILILIASVASFIIGWLWYGPIFGKLWMKLNKKGDVDMRKGKNKSMIGMMALSFVGTVITAYVLSILLSSLEIFGVGESMMLSFFIWLGFLMTTTILGSVLWEGKPWGLFVLNAAYWLVTLEVITLVLTYGMIWI